MEPEKQEETVVEATEQVKTEQESAPANEPGQDKGALAPDDTSAEAQLAAEALEAADTVPVGVVAGLRARSRGKDEVIRAKDELINRLQAEIDERKTVAPTLSPAQQFIRDNELFDPESQALPAAIQIAQDQWKEKQAEEKAQAEAVARRKEMGNRSYREAKAAYSDYDDIVALGQQYLTPGDKLDIASADDPATELYRRSISRTLESKTEDSEVLRNHLKSKLPTKKTVQPPPVKENTQEREAPASPPNEEPEYENMNPRLAHICNAFGV